MTNEQINIAIAEEMGEKWKRLDGSHHPYKWTRNGIKIMPHIIPSDYCNDLNAMHKALELISQQCKDSDFWFFLREIIGFPDAESDWDEYYYFQAINATARQRAEAFLRTLGKWKE